MPRLDSIHNIVKQALINAGWTITDDPYIIEYQELTLYADLAAERALAAERGGQKIVVEVKSFIGLAKLQELKTALGQYDIYASFLELLTPERKLYVAVSAQIHADFFSRPAIQVVMRRTRLPLIVVDLDTEEVVQWIN